MFHSSAVLVKHGLVALGKARTGEGCLVSVYSSGGFAGAELSPAELSLGTIRPA